MKLDFQNIFTYLCIMNESMIGKKVSIKFPIDKFRWGIDDNCKVDKETEKAVHVVRSQSKGVIRDTTISRWVPKSRLQDKGDHFLVVMTI